MNFFHPLGSWTKCNTGVGPGGTANSSIRSKSQCFLLTWSFLPPVIVTCRAPLKALEMRTFLNNTCLWVIYLTIFYYRCKWKPVIWICAFQNEQNRIIRVLNVKCGNLLFPLKKKKNLAISFLMGCSGEYFKVSGELICLWINIYGHVLILVIELKRHHPYYKCSWKTRKMHCAWSLINEHLFVFSSCPCFVFHCK